ncbi:hypothetical protein ACS0TY_007887 [Phlomoides rotata]
MSSKGGYTAAPPRQGGDRFYNPPMVRRHQQVLQQQLMQRQLLQQQQQQQHHQQPQQHQLQRRAAAKAGSSSAEKQTDADESSMAVALPLRHSVSPASAVQITNLDRLMESVTPFIEARYLTEVNAMGPITGTSEVESRAFFYLEDLWASFSEWSVYGAGVPLLLNGRDPIEQYYVPSLSGMQLFTDPAPQYRLISSSGSSRLWTGENSAYSSASADAVMANSPGLPLFEFLEGDQPYNRRPLTERAGVLASKHPEMRRVRSCDLLPTSWISVAWYPIYRIPVGPTLQDLDASFLTFHSLSTQSIGSCAPPQAQVHAANTRVVRGFADPTARISLPVFALASYKLKGSILSPCGPHECKQEDSLLQAADNWLKYSQVILPDYQFFRSHWR